MNKKVRIKSLIFLYASLGIFTYLYSEHDYKDNNYAIYEVEDYKPFGSYSKGNIYIGSKYYIDSIIGRANPCDVLIVQGYKTTNNCLDPNYKIISSYLVKDRDDRNAILNVINEYNNLTSFEFNRTLESMRAEWSIHNILYNLGIETYRTKDVDLNNGDEIIYSNPILKRILK